MEKISTVVMKMQTSKLIYKGSVMCLQGVPMIYKCHVSQYIVVVARLRTHCSMAMSAEHSRSKFLQPFTSNGDVSIYIAK